MIKTTIIFIKDSENINDTNHTNLLQGGIMGHSWYPLQYQANASRLHVIEGVPLKHRRALTESKPMITLQQ